MSQFSSSVMVALAFTALAGAQATKAPAPATPPAGGADSAVLDTVPGLPMDAMKGMDEMEGKSAHLKLTDPQPAQPGDAARAQAIVSTLQGILPAYKDYHAAVAAGFEPFAVTLEALESEDPPAKKDDPLGAIVHFTSSRNALRAQLGFDAAHPTSWLYRRLGKDKLVLVGAMYTAPFRASAAMLDRRVPLSVARWHEHVALCIPPAAQMATADWSRFGPEGTIVTEAGCAEAGGTFYARLFGWMVHVYPMESTPEKIWAH